MKKNLILEKFSELAALERLMIETYTDCRSGTDDPALERIFSTLMADEERHLGICKNIIDIIESG